ncbi:F-box domain containing protein [Diplocarpon rosae]|nr:F-box domain containing protein [Diplocarpon rosae]
MKHSPAAKKTNTKQDMTWPLGIIPVELFTLITSYLPRSNIQNMRLVNKEFDQKVSEALFRIVVVPFRPEIYGITPETTSSNDVAPGSIMIQDHGMRVFQGFGRWIRRFAMSFEIDLLKLATPPRKSDQEAITTFWGIYRWPFKNYNRYSQLEGLEQTADETRTMAKALKYISKVKELGLSIDGGLGWLAGPDVNRRLLERGEKLPVFGVSKFAPEPIAQQTRQARNSFEVKASTDPQNSTRRTQYERMLQALGYTGEDLAPAMEMFMATEGLGLDGVHPEVAVPDGRGSVEGTADTVVNNVTWGLQTPQVANLWGRPRRSANNNSNNNNVSNHHNEWFPFNVSVSDEDTDEDAGSRSQAAVLTGQRARAKLEGTALKPNDLTISQREMLLEMEWAQNAFMQSWAIAIIDNHDTFCLIETLTIARIPNRHLSILRREDFWDSLPSLKALSLAIIPDWREVKKEATSWVQDTKIAPSHSILGVHDILTQQISRRENIKNLHFEWLCGGEYAPGIFARNQHILAAPIVSNAMHMVDRTQQYSVLSLPHIKNLSLRNCWVSPHVLSRFLVPMRQGALESVSFDSVSLTAMVPANARPSALTQAAAQAMPHNLPAAIPHAHIGLVNLLGMQLLQNGNAQAAPAPPVATSPNSQPNWLNPPRVGSWAHIIDSITPGITLADVRYSRDRIYEPEPKVPTNLTKLVFKSCGYVRLPLDFDQSILDPLQAPPQQHAALVKRQGEIEQYMMKPLENSTLGTIINHIDNVEKLLLENVWNMIVGWRTLRPDLAADALSDGVAKAGQGRFDGSIEFLQASSSKRHSP